jgi:hypothetical protein
MLGFRIATHKEGKEKKYSNIIVQPQSSKVCGISEEKLRLLWVQQIC